MGNHLPQGWAYPKLKDVVKYQKGKKPKILEDEPFPNSEPYLDIKAFEKDEIRRYADIDSSHLIYENEIGIVWDGARSGWVGMNKKGAVGSTIAILKPLMINEIYLFRFLQSKFNYINENTRGSGIPHVDPQVLWDIDFPLPPRAEQDRIVAKVDALMEQHAAIQQTMERIPQLLKDFRQQLLTQAVTGKLTEAWRVGKELNVWKTLNANEVFTFITSGSRGWAQYYNPSGNQLFVRITNMNFGTFHLDLSENKLQFLELPESNEGKRTLLKENDILISITGDVGMVSLIQSDFKYEAYVNQHVCLARPEINHDAKFISYYLMSKEGFGQLDSKKRGATKSGLTLGDIRSLLIQIPPLREQQEIVRRVESLFEKAMAIEQRYEQLKAQIDTLPQAILHKAFKGELVEQLDSDGSAVELLREIENLKSKPASSGSREVVGGKKGR